MESIKSQIEALQNELEQVLVDVEKFEEKGNKAAGTRIRKAMQNVKNGAQSVRTSVSERNKTNA
jgi:ElaB/YqjD/DUF883 family membrane-anchored ribosome-binding protein